MKPSTMVKACRIDPHRDSTCVRRLKLIYLVPSALFLPPFLMIFSAELAEHYRDLPSELARAWGNPKARKEG